MPVLHEDSVLTMNRAVKLYRRDGRPDSTEEECASKIRKLQHWINKTKHPNSVYICELMRGYVLIMANTGREMPTARSVV